MTSEELYLAIGEIRSDVKTLLTRHDNAEKRLSAVERKIWTASGIAIAVSTFATTAVAKLLGH